MNQSKVILPVIVISQFCCTSLWFAGNAVMTDLAANFDLGNNALGHLISVVQFGFIIGTLVFAILTIADRFSPSKVFLVCAILGSLSNLCIVYEGNTIVSILVLRFTTGFFLAGIYPVGMKIAADYYEKGLGKSLGLLVGALVIGSAFPHLLQGLTAVYSWKAVLLTTSIIAVAGGMMMAVMVPDGPYRKPSQQLNLSAFFSVFQNSKFRSAAFGYFGHMWELYAFWTFIPIMLASYNIMYTQADIDVPFSSFLIMGIGSISCVLGSYIAPSIGTKRTASIILLLSCICCLVSPLMYYIHNTNIFLAFLLFWGMVVIADSPLFSTLVAQNAPPEIKGTALTIVNCIGFSITIVSIQLISEIRELTESNIIYTILAIGPIMGLLALRSRD